MTFTPYLMFDGTCGDAMRFYAEAFGATDLQLMPFSDAPPEVGMPDEDRYMHAQFSAGDHVLMACDMPSNMPTPPQASVSVSHRVADAQTGKVIFNKLAEGGQVLMPFEATFFAEGFGMVQDKFGTHWMINTSVDG